MNFTIIRTTFIVVGIFASQAAIASGINVCLAKKNDGQSIGETVSFKGKILSDGVHSTLIVPDKCRGIGFFIAPDETEDSPAAIIRQSVMKIGSPGTGDKKIAVEVDAIVTAVGNHHFGLKITRLKQLVLTYPNDG